MPRRNRAPGGRGPAADAALDFVDKTQQGTLRVLRKIVARIDQVSTAAMPRRARAPGERRPAADAAAHRSMLGHGLQLKAAQHEGAVAQPTRRSLRLVARELVNREGMALTALSGCDRFATIAMRLVHPQAARAALSATGGEKASSVAMGLGNDQRRQRRTMTRNAVPVENPWSLGTSHRGGEDGEQAKGAGARLYRSVTVSS